MIEVKTNRTARQPEYRLRLTTKEVRDFVFLRFKFMPTDKKFKLVKWTNHNGLVLHYKKTDEGVKVGFEEPGYGVTGAYYTLNQLEELMLPF